MPNGCDLVAAGALPVAYGTSHVALVHRAQLKSGQVPPMRLCRRHFQNYQDPVFCK